MTKLADKLREALKAGRSGQLAQQSPYSRFGLSHDPFRLDVDPASPDFLLTREQVLLEFAIQIGNAIRLFDEDPASPFRHLLAHGLQGCGKSFLARHFDREWTQIGFQDYQTLYTDLSTWKEPLDYEEFLKQIGFIEKPLIIFVDCLDFIITGTPAIPRVREFMGDIEARARHGVIIIGFVNSLTLTVLLDDEYKILSRIFLSYFNPEHFFFPVFSKNEIIELLSQRLKVARSPTELFSSKALELIADHSLGIPTVALQLASACLNELIVQAKHKATVPIVTTVITQGGYIDALRLVESIDHEVDEDMASIITPKRRKIIAIILSHQLRERFFFPPTGIDGLRSSDLAELFGVNLSTMNYHLKPLSSSDSTPILEVKDDALDARSKIFYVNWQSHMASALEIITVYHRLQQARYNIQPATILSSRRKVS